MKAIVVADREWNIGIDGKLLVHLPKDLKYFKEKTSGKTVVMGRLTFESLPGQRPLPDRTNIIMTREPKVFLEKYSKQIKGFKTGEVIIVKDQAELFAYLTENAKGCIQNRTSFSDTFIIGGGQVYRHMLPYCDQVFVTRLDKTFIGDTSFPNLDEDKAWELVWQSEQEFENDVRYLWTRYKRCELGKE